MFDIESSIINLLRLGLPAGLTLAVLYPIYSICKWTYGFSWKLLGGFLVAGFIIWLVLVSIIHWIIRMFRDRQ